MSDNIAQVSDASFEADVLNSSTPVLVDYWAEWCGPCKALAPVLEDVARDYGERLKIAKLDVEANPETAAKYRVQAIPTLMLFKDGKPHAQERGALSKSRLKAFIDSNL